MTMEQGVLRRETCHVLIALGVFLLSMLLISFVNEVLVVYYAAVTGSSLEAASMAMFRQVLVLLELLLAGLAILFFTKVFKRRLIELGLTATRLVRNTAVGVLVGAGGWSVATIIALTLYRLVPYEVPESYTRTVTPSSTLDLVYLLMITWVLVGPCEELFFRGFIQGTFTFWKGPEMGVIAGSVLFGLAHFSPLLWFPSIPAAAVGIIYGIVYLKRRSIVPVAVAHSMNNTIGFALAFLLS